MAALHELLVTAEVDMTIFFRALADVRSGCADARTDARRVLRRSEAARGGARIQRLARPLWSARASRRNVAGIAPGWHARSQPMLRAAQLSRAAGDRPRRTGRSRRHPRVAGRAAPPLRRSAWPRAVCAATTGLGARSGRMLDAVVQLLTGTRVIDSTNATAGGAGVECKNCCSLTFPQPPPALVAKSAQCLDVSPVDLGGVG